ncbi:DUF11 domain-containing protein [Dictyobacter kobayashii]|uniref:DUF11 domain-containing protein n=1 Tax=Dictyobacter kobayashii TaxID=2014872 RepID=A0A402AG35_9CHLR|nr:DUF11 domain-containing protein [Dictyobacter kobayashii]GCE18052.1 hypothetical protein KDK_18520 [Dictyobacter kobayashii]
MKIKSHHAKNANPTKPVTTPAVDLAMNLTLDNSLPLSSGDSITFNLSVTNVSDTDVQLQPGDLGIDYVLPAGLEDVSTTDQQWSTTYIGVASPLEIVTTNNNTVLLHPGDSTVILQISGDLLDSAVPALTSTATLSYDEDTNPANDTATLTVPISPAMPLAAVPTKILKVKQPPVPAHAHSRLKLRAHF